MPLATFVIFALHYLICVSKWSAKNHGHAWLSGNRVPSSRHPANCFNVAERTTLFAQNSWLKASYVHDDIETLLSPWYLKTDDTLHYSVSIHFHLQKQRWRKRKVSDANRVLKRNQCIGPISIPTLVLVPILVPILGSSHFSWRRHITWVHWRFYCSWQVPIAGEVALHVQVFDSTSEENKL